MTRADADELSGDAVEAALRNEVLGTRVQVFPIAVTTDALALAWSRQHAAPEGALVVADCELSARGRRGATWVSVPGKSLALSVVLRPDLPPEGEDLLWALAALGAAEGIEAEAEVPVAVKWPNDLLRRGRRLGLVRAEATLGPGRIEAAVLTVRVNVGLVEADFPASVRSSVTSLALEGTSASRLAVLASVLERVEARYRGSASALLDAYRARCTTLGRHVVAHLMPAGAVDGIAVGVDGLGRLVVDEGGRRRALRVDELKRLDVD